jgi:hypothetical protein
MERHHEHPAAPGQTDEGFAEGLDQKPDTPEEEAERRFSEGIEQLPETPGRSVGAASARARAAPRDAGEGHRAPLQRGSGPKPDQRLADRPAPS